MFNNNLMAADSIPERVLAYEALQVNPTNSSFKSVN